MGVVEMPRMLARTTLVECRADEDGHRTYVARWLVEAPSHTEKFMIMDSPGLPRVGDAWLWSAPDPYAHALHIRPEDVQYKMEGVWEVIVRYTTKCP